MNKIDFPLVSICMPTYNGEAYITEALNSAIHQDYPNLEIIISDDASVDETLSIVESFKTKTKIPIKVYRHKPNGIGANWNHSVKQSNGEFVKFLFQDDTLQPNCISKMMLYMKNMDVGLVYSKRNFIYDTLTTRLEDFIKFYGHLHNYWQDFSVSEGILDGKVYLRDRQFLNTPKNKIGEPTNVLLRKSCFEKVGYFNEVLKQALDSNYWYRVMQYYDVGFVDECLASFRLHDKQASNINRTIEIPDKELMYKEYYKDLFWYLHPKNRLKLLKLYHPVFKMLVRIKQFFDGK